MSNKQMYIKPVVLNSITHKTLKVASASKYNFATGFNSCIVLCQEFPEAVKYYPIVFSRVNDSLTPMAILGINNNLFVDSDGKWQKGTYVPAFIRRYPFILAEGLTQDGSLTVCIDSAYEGYDTEDGERLFDYEGEPTSSLESAMNFLQLYHNQYEATKAFVNYMKDLNILKAVDANITLANGKEFTLKDLSVVDEQAMLNLPDNEILTLVKKGYLSWIYAHLYSITNFNKMIGREG